MNTTPFALQPLDSAQIARRRVAVVGGGLMGVATAAALARLGGERIQVDLYEMSEVGNEAAASVDATRGFRHIYGEHAHYTRWAAEVLELWADLERLSGRTLYEPCGNVWVVHAGAPRAMSASAEKTFSSADAMGFVRTSQATMRALGVPSELLDGDEFRRRYPQFADPTIAAALLDTLGGRLFARESVLALRAVGTQRGVRIHERSRAVEVIPTPDSCGIRFADGSSVEVDAMVLAVGGWSGTLLAGIDGGPNSGSRAEPTAAYEPSLEVSEQPVYYLAPPPDRAEEFAAGRFPLFVLASSGLWGHPSCYGAVKMADGNPGRTLQRPEERRLTDDEYRQATLDALIQQFPGLRDSALVQERVCFYDNSPDGDFLMDQWDEQARLIVGYGFSGHGFKFGPLIGAKLAQYALSGQRPADLVRFSKARFAVDPELSRHTHRIQGSQR